MINQITLVQRFHEAMGLTVNYKPTWPSLKDAQLPIALMQEELKEVIEEVNNNDVGSFQRSLPNLTKEIADTIVVVLGTIVTYGLQDVIIPVFEEIMASNFSKLGDDGKPLINGQNGVLDETRPLGKVLKGPNHRPADVTHIFKQYEKA